MKIESLQNGIILKSETLNPTLKYVQSEQILIFIEITNRALQKNY